MTQFTSGSGPFTVYFEADGCCYLLRRKTLAAAKTEALVQAKQRSVFVSVQNRGRELFVASPEGASAPLDGESLSDSSGEAS